MPKRVSDELNELMDKKNAADKEGTPVKAEEVSEPTSFTQACNELRAVIRAELKCSMQSFEVQDLMYLMNLKLDQIQTAHLEEMQSVDLD